MKTACLRVVPLAAETAVLESAAGLGESSRVILECYTGIVFKRWQGQTLGQEFAGRTSRRRARCDGAVRGTSCRAGSFTRQGLG